MVALEIPHFDRNGTPIEVGDLVDTINHGTRIVEFAEDGVVVKGADAERRACTWVIPYEGIVLVTPRKERARTNALRKLCANAYDQGVLDFVEAMSRLSGVRWTRNEALHYLRNMPPALKTRRGGMAPFSDEQAGPAARDR